MASSSIEQILQLLFGYVEAIGQWMMDNFAKIAYSGIAVLVGYVFQFLLSNRIDNLSEEGRINEHLANTLGKIVKWGTSLAVLSIVLVEFGVTFAMLSGFMTLLGGTIVGFAAINTLGNAIAGLIIMASKPFRVGDRVFFNERFSDVLSIDLIYTKLLTMDYILVSVPNQNILKTEIENYGKRRIVRLRTVITAGYEHDPKFVKEVLLEASMKVDNIIDAPRAYVRITQFKDFAVEYTLYTFIQRVKRLREIEAELRDVVFETCSEYGIDLSTPTLIVAQKMPKDNESQDIED
ncbi:mechanosensitive ion channel [Candidatus Bathyarchaeota archaeon]|nr:mechanosensitive ion channel [Candidatus Bathyarchaeota archaeon]